MTVRDSVGVDVGGSFVKGVRLSADGSVSDRLVVPTPGTADGIIDAVVDAVVRLGPTRRVGVGLAGLVDHGSGALVWGPHLRHRGLAVGARVGESLGVPVVVDNDANMAVVAEATMGAAVGRRHVVLVALGTGIGVGIRLGERIVRGRGHAGEAGHMIVTTTSPRVCACGRRGCWETEVSGRVLDEAARRLFGPAATTADLVSSARSGDEAASDVLTDAGHRLATGLEVILLLLDPDVIVVGGAVSAAGDLLLEPARRRLAGTEGGAHREPTDVVEGMLGADAGAIGAAIAATGELTG